MAHLRLDDGFAAEPTIAALTDGEFRVWLRLLCQCARYKRPAVTAATRREIRGLGPQRIARFVSLGLLHEAGPDAYEVDDWTKFQPADPTAAERKARWRAREATRSEGP